MAKWLDKYDAPQAQNGIEGTMGGLTDVGFNYNGAWGGTMQMGGSLPGAVGFMYARTQSPAPSNGPYAKKTKASAQNGQEMKYYQEGLDFKPKTISQNGSRTPIVVTDPKDPRLKAYKDSLSLYNKFKNAKTDYKNLIISKGFDPSYIEEWTTNGYVDKDVHPKIGAVRYGILQNSGGGFDRDNNYNPRGFNNYPTMSGKQLTVYEDTNLGKAIGTRYPVYKKPVQPVEYRAPQRDTLYVSDVNDPRLKAYQDSLAVYNSSKFIKEHPLTGNYIPGKEDERQVNINIDKKNVKKYNPKFATTYTGYYWDYKKPVQPVILEEEPRFEKPIPIPRDTRDLGYTLPTPGQFTAPKLYKYDPDTPTKFSFTYPTGGYNEQKTMYFPSKAALKSFVGGVRGATYQEGKDYASATGTLQDGGYIPVDPMGYWNPENVGGPVIIPSNVITMEGVDQPLLGISDTGDVQYMEPGEDYEFDGEYVTEYPMAKGGVSVNNADAQPLKKLDQLLNFTNYNKPTKGGWLDKYN